MNQQVEIYRYINVPDNINDIMDILWTRAHPMSRSNRPVFGWTVNVMASIFRIPDQVRHDVQDTACGDATAY